MNDEKRVALVEAFTQIVFNLESPNDYWHLQPADEQYRTRRHAEELFDDTLGPIIDRIHADHDIDAMLDAVHPETYVELILTNPGEWEASVWMPGLDWSYEEPTATGTGTTRTSAIADACRKAMEGRGDE